MTPSFYLSIQNSYHILQVALFQGDTCLEKLSLHDVRASSHLIVHIDTMLKKHKLLLPDLAFITADAGPGAFTSLRVAIATLNGVAFSGKVPLIGVNGLEALFHDGLTAAAPTKAVGVVGLLNAYNQDAYFCFGSTADAIMREHGCKKIHEVLDAVAMQFPTGVIQLCGNGIQVFAAELEQRFAGRIQYNHEALPVASVEQIARLGYQAWMKKAGITYAINPHYLKTQLFAVQRQVPN